jgi:hypothetical protein
MREKELTGALVQTTAGEYGLQTELAVAMRGVGHLIIVRPEVTRAIAAAEQLKGGYVITNEAQAIEVADLAAQVIDGERALEGQVKDALRIPKQMEAALRSAVEPTRDRLANARQIGNAARVAWQSELRRRAIQEEAKRRQEAQEAARKAAEQASETGDDAPPVAEVAQVEIPRIVSGGTGKMGTQIRIEPVGIEDFSVCPKEWLELNTAAARTMFLAMKVQKPEPGESVVWQGVRFRAVESAINRR